MKFYILFGFALLLNQSFAQNDLLPIAGSQLLYSDDYYQQKNQPEKETLQKNKVRSRSIVQITGDKRTKTVETYDEFGNILTYDYFNKKGENSVSNSFTYDSKQRPVFVKYKYGKKQAWQSFEYDASGLLKRSRGYNTKEEFFGREEFSREDGKMLAITIWQKDSISPYKRLDYEYHEDGKIKTIRYFFKSDLKYTWSYDCKPEGELQGTKQKDTTTICIKEEHDASGKRIVWKQELNRKGDLIKTKMVYEKDSTLILSESYDMDERLLSQRNYFKDGGELFFSYDKKGNVYYTSETIYNTNKQLVKRSSAHGKQFSNHRYFYSGDLLTTSIFTNRYQTTVSEYGYTYYYN